MAKRVGAPWDYLEEHEVRVGPDLPLRWHAPHQQGDRAPRLVFLPGIVSDSRAWYRQAALGRRRPVAFLDLPKAVPQAPYTFDILALLVMDAIRQLCDSPPVLVGTSFGGMAALTCAVSYPQGLSGLILGSTTCDARWFRYPQQLMRLATNALPRVPDQIFQRTFPTLCHVTGALDRQDRESRDMMADHARAFGSRHYANRLHAVGELRLEDRLGELHMPTLVLHGTADRTIPLKLGLRMAERIPHATVRVLPGGGHSFYLRQAQWFIDEVEAWLDATGL